MKSHPADYPACTTDLAIKSNKFRQSILGRKFIQLIEQHDRDKIELLKWGNKRQDQSRAVKPPKNNFRQDFCLHSFI